MSHKFGQISRRWIVVSLMAMMATAALSTPARAQDAITKEAAAALKASFIADLDVVKGKFVGLAEAFPQDKYTWRPMALIPKTQTRSFWRKPVSPSLGGRGYRRSPE